MRTALVLQPGRVPTEQARRFQFGTHVGDLVGDDRLRGQRLSELLAHLGVGDGGLEAGLADAQGLEGDADAPAVQRREGHAQAGALLAQPVQGRHARLVQRDDRGVRGPQAHLVLLLGDRQPGRVALDQEGVRALVAVRAGLARHDDVERGAGAVRHERLGAAEHVVVAVAARRRAEGRGVRAGTGLGHAEGRDLAGSHARQEALLHLVGAEQRDRIRADAVVHGQHHADAGAGLRQLLDDQAVGQRVDAEAAVGLGKRQAEEAGLAQGVDQRVGHAAFDIHLVRDRRDVLAREVPHHVAEHRLVLVQREVHRSLPVALPHFRRGPRAGPSQV